MASVLFFHGKESGPFGSKYRALKESFPGIISPDFRGLELSERVDKALSVLSGLSGEVVIIGSSMGGLVAALVASKRRLAGMVLLAPALNWEEASAVDVASWPEETSIMHGIYDEVVPHTFSVDYADNSGASLFLVEDGHRLHEFMDGIVCLAEAAVAAGGGES